MSRTLSTNFLAQINMPESGDAFLPMVSLSHPSWPDDLNLVANTEDIDHNGVNYTAIAFMLTLPEDADDRLPFMDWRIDGASREIVSRIRGLTGAIQAQVFYVLSSAPDVKELGPYAVEMQVADYTADTVSGTLTIEPVLDQPFGYLTFNPSTTPALF